MRGSKSECHLKRGKEIYPPNYERALEMLSTDNCIHHKTKIYKAESLPERERLGISPVSPDTFSNTLKKERLRRLTRAIFKF